MLYTESCRERPHCYATEELYHNTYMQWIHYSFRGSDCFDISYVLTSSVCNLE